QDVLLQPGRQTDSVPLGGLTRFPWGLLRDRSAHLPYLDQPDAKVHRRPRAHRPWDCARIAVLLAVDDHHRVAVDVLLARRHTELIHQRVDAVLARPDPGAATINPRTGRGDLGLGAPADSISCLQQDHRATG